MSAPLMPFRLNDGHHLPAIGLGTFGMTGEDGIATLVAGLHAGYRLMDTAVGYGNEAEVGEAIRRSGIPWSDIVVTTKVKASGHGYEEARRSIQQSRRTLGIDQIGLQLIHWPNPRLGRFVDTWRALVDARSDGEVRSIGVSNFTQRYLQPIIDATGVTPAVNQVEVHPHFLQEDQRRVDFDLQICTQSWSPFGRGPVLLHSPEITGPAQRADVTPGQVVLRWHHQLGLVPIPRSSNPLRQRQNLEIANFELTAGEVAAISGLGLMGGRLWDGDPDTTTL